MRVPPVVPVDDPSGDLPTHRGGGDRAMAHTTAPHESHSGETI